LVYYRSGHKPVSQGPLVVRKKILVVAEKYHPQSTPSKAIDPGCAETQGCAAHLAHGNTRLASLTLRTTQGVHRQVLMTTLGFCLGYYIKRYSNYYYAERDRELFSYIKHHPEDFVEKEPRKVGEILEDFTPTR
uniref:NADH dehydrogenase [ubiquinone] 1 subunit C2 n=1 Tax=Pseudonaja textilis TaxID=8673 RepID=A0A670ZHW6_PSETE